MKPKAKKEDTFDISKVTVDPNLKSHANDPFVVRKVEEAKRVLATLKKPLSEYYKLIPIFLESVVFLCDEKYSFSRNIDDAVLVAGP